MTFESMTVLALPKTRKSFRNFTDALNFPGEAP